MRHSVLKTAITLTSILLYWLLTTILIWCTYGAGQAIISNSTPRNDAATATAEMALIITILTIPLWLLRKRSHAPVPYWQRFWPVAWKTAIVLLLYACIVMMRGNRLTAVGAIRLFDDVNGYFFGELGFLVFFPIVVPSVALLSGSVYSLNDRLVRTWAPSAAQSPPDHP